MTAPLPPTHVLSGNDAALFSRFETYRAAMQGGVAHGGLSTLEKSALLIDGFLLPMLVTFPSRFTLAATLNPFRSRSFPWAAFLALSATAADPIPDPIPPAQLPRSRVTLRLQIHGLTDTVSLAEVKVWGRVRVVRGRNSPTSLTAKISRRMLKSIHNVANDGWTTSIT